VILIAGCKSPTQYTNDFIVAGVVRNSGDGWGLIEDSTHTARNVLRVTEDNNNIIVYYAKPASMVVSLVVTPDEEFASQGYFVGASVGLEACYIRIYKEIGGIITQINPEDLISNSGNFWIYGIFEE
jgi:hypothetical protein